MNDKTLNLVWVWYGRPAVILTLVIATAMLAVALRYKSSGIPASQAVRAIIGEASGEGWPGMLAVACALRNRGTLKGVYGLKAAHVDREQGHVWQMAKLAWSQSAWVDVTHGADHWHNVKREGENYWTKAMVKTDEVGSHAFYKKRGQK